MPTCALCPHHTYELQYCTFPRSHALRLEEDVIGLSRLLVADECDGRRKFCIRPTLALLCSHTARSKEPRKTANPRKLTPISHQCSASATTAGRPVSNTIMQANGGHPRKHKDEFVYNICKWLIIHSSACPYRNAFSGSRNCLPLATQGTILCNHSGGRHPSVRVDPEARR